MNMQFYSNGNNVIFNKNILTRITKNNNIQNNNIQTDNSLENTKQRWGSSIWFLFHTLAEKIKEEEFLNLKDQLLDIIKSICMNLPCPECSSHATKYIQNLNYISIKKKDDLKIFLFNFHNYVNKRKGFKIFSLDELNSKYKKSNTINIIKNFILIYQYKNKSFNMIANEIQKQRQLDVFKNWINNNIQSFEL